MVSSDRMPRAARHALPLLLLALFAAALGLAMYVPLYTDEIGTKWQLSRVFAEGGRMLSLLPQCKSSWIQSPPVSFYPGAALYALLYGHAGLVGIKLGGILAGALWLACGWVLTGRRLGRFAAFVAAQGLGLLPLVLAMGRSEGMLLVMVAGFVAFPLFLRLERQRTPARRAAVTIAFVLLASVFAFTHPKALVYAPFLFVSAWLTFRPRKAWLAIAIAGVLFVDAQAFTASRRLVMCPEAPTVARIFGMVALSPSVAASDPRLFVTTAAHNLADHAVHAVDDLVPAPKYPSGWLPAGELTPVARAAVAVSKTGLYAVEIAAPALLAIAIARSRSRRARRLELLAAAILACLLAHLALTTVWAFYNSVFAFAQLALVGALAARALGPRHGLAWRRASVVLVAMGCASLLALLVHLGPRLVALRDLGTTSLPGSPSSVPALGYDAERTKIRAHAERCGLHADGSRRMVFDDATLFAFQDLREPLHLIYVTDANMWASDTLGDKDVAFLRDVGASGIVSRCTFFPHALVPIARKQDGYCCVSAEDLQAPR